MGLGRLGLGRLGLGRLCLGRIGLGCLDMGRFCVKRLGAGRWLRNLGFDWRRGKACGALQSNFQRRKNIIYDQKLYSFI